MAASPILMLRIHWPAIAAAILPMVRNREERYHCAGEPGGQPGRRAIKPHSADCLGVRPGSKRACPGEPQNTQSDHEPRGACAMAKGMEKRKESKKKPGKTLKEKRAKKAAKKG